MGPQLKEALTKSAIFALKMFICWLIAKHLASGGYFFGALFFFVVNIYYAWHLGGAIGDSLMAWLNEEDEDDA